MAWGGSENQIIRTEEGYPTGAALTTSKRSMLRSVFQLAGVAGYPA
jgi:hypothetical protein